MSISSGRVRLGCIRFDHDDERSAMRYLLMVCWDAERMNGQTEPRPGGEPRDEEPVPWVGDLRAQGIWLAFELLAPTRRARLLRVRRGKKMVDDGPFGETKETIVGLDLIQCDSLDEAVEIAATHPMAEAGTIEVRPLWGH